MAHKPKQLRAIAENLGGPLMYLAGRGGLAGTEMTLDELGRLGYRIVADPQTPLLAAFGAWKQAYADLRQGFGAGAPVRDWSALEEEMLDIIGLEQLLEIERHTTEISAASSVA
jgi:methylisocitrate lyase